MNPADYGDETVYNLTPNEALQREIAYWFVTQGTYPGGVNKINASPSAVVEAVQQATDQGKSEQEWYAVGIYMRDGSGGHAVTPAGVEDKGGGLYDILIYDNNWPVKPAASRMMPTGRPGRTWPPPTPTKAKPYEGDLSTQTRRSASARLGFRSVTSFRRRCRGRWPRSLPASSITRSTWMVKPTR
jgi:hypothetical protein